MRTDSNSVLSLSSNIPPKKPISTKAPSKSGDAFANDFNKAKNTLASDKASSRGDSSMSTQSSVTDAKASSSDEIATTKESKKDSTPINDRSSNGEAEISDKAVASKNNDIRVDSSGKKLQGEGEVAPVQGMSGAISTDAEVPASTLTTTTINSDAELAVPDAEPLITVDGVLDSSEVVTTGVMPQNTPVMTTVQSVDAIKASSDATADGKNIAGVVGLKSAASGDDLASTSNSVESSGEMVDPNLEGSESSLSWVLSQMANPVTKAASGSVTGQAEIDSSKVVSGAAAAAVAGSVVNKEGRSGVIPQSLLGVGAATSVEGDSVDLSNSLLTDDGVLINEPIELRKKEQEAMIGRMSAQIDGNFADDNSTGGLNSSLHNNVNRAAVVAANAPAMAPQNNLTMSLPPGHPGWANEMTQKVAWIARDGGHTAHIRLDPPELGSLTVKVSVDSDSNTQISFVAATPQARDLLEGQMGRLRDMLAQQGMDLSRADVDVSQQDTSGAQDRSNESANGSSQGLLASNDELEEELDSNNLSYVSASGVDYYA